MVCQMEAWFHLARTLSNLSHASTIVHGPETGEAIEVGILE